MNNTKLVAIGISIVLILAFCGLFAYNFFFIKDVKTFDMYLGVSNIIGVNVDSDAIYFGITRPGGTTKRNLNLTNNYGYPMVVSIRITGNISPFVTVSDNNFIIQPGENMHITYYAQPTINTSYGRYTGETKLSFKRTLFWK